MSPARAAVPLLAAILAAACSPPPPNTGHTIIVVNERAAPIRVHPTNGDPNVDYVVEAGETRRIEGLNLPTYTDNVGDVVIDVGTVLVWTADCEPIGGTEVSTGEYTVVVGADGVTSNDPSGAEAANTPDAESVSPAC